MHAPAAARNAEAISHFLRRVAPASGRALELASGTGQHILRFAQDMPDLHWHPTDIAPDRLRSIAAYQAERALGNLAPAGLLDATQEGWSTDHAGQDLIVVINLLHLISAAQVQVILSEAGRALAPDGGLMIYGPFRRDGILTSAGDKRFDADLRAADPKIGYKDTRDMKDWLSAAGLRIGQQQEMPANNLALFCMRKE